MLIMAQCTDGDKKDFVGVALTFWKSELDLEKAGENMGTIVRAIDDVRKKPSDSTIKIRLLEAQDIIIIAAAFAGIGWNKPASQYERYLAEQVKGERVVLVAYRGKDCVGYVTIQWKSDYPPFAEKSIPEIQDLNVLPAFRRKGLASALVDEAEKRIFERSKVAGIGFGVSADYGAAQRMYILRGYVPDGRGLFGYGRYIRERTTVLVDDCVIYLTKERNE